MEAPKHKGRTTVTMAYEENQGGFRQDDRPMFDAVCSECGKECKVPFQPKEGRPVYCRECYQSKRPPRREF